MRRHRHILLQRQRVKTSEARALNSLNVYTNRAITGRFSGQGGAIGSLCVCVYVFSKNFRLLIRHDTVKYIVRQLNRPKRTL